MQNGSLVKQEDNEQRDQEEKFIKKAVRPSDRSK